MTSTSTYLKLYQCVKSWEKDGVTNLHWLENESPDTVVEYVLIPDLMGIEPAKPSWTFISTGLKARFVIKNNRLFPETIFNKDNFTVSSFKERSLSYESDMQSTRLFGDATRSSYATEFTFRLSKLIEVKKSVLLTGLNEKKVDRLDANNLISKWLDFAYAYCNEVDLLKNDYNRLLAFIEIIDPGAPDIATMYESEFYGVNACARFLVYGDYFKKIDPAYLNPDLWENTAYFPEDKRTHFFKHTYMLPGVASLLAKLAISWSMPVWSLMESFSDPANWAKFYITDRHGEAITLIEAALSDYEEDKRLFSQLPDMST